MSHMVIYRGSDGKPGYHQTDDIHDAVGFVEQMRNEQGVEHARIFRLEEVVFQYKQYYRVELSEGGAAAIETAAEQSDSGASPTTDTGDVVITANGGTTADEASSAGDTGSTGNGNGEQATVSTTETAATSSSSEVSTATSAVAEEAAEAGAKRGLFGR